MADREGLLGLFRNDSGEELVLELAEEPHPATRRLMDFLGVRIEVAAVTSLDLETRYCVRPLCMAEALAGSFYCRNHAPISQLRPRNGHDADPGLAALEAMDRGEPQPAAIGKAQPEQTFQGVTSPEPAPALKPEPSENGHASGHGVARWTRATAILAVQAWAEKHGRPPRQLDAKGDPSLPNPSTARTLGWSWADLIEEAGFSRPTRGKTKGPLTAAHREAIREGMQAAKDSPKPEVVAWLVSVPGTGLRYRTALEAQLAADEIEEDGRRVAEAARFDGHDGKADQALDASRELAEKIRAAAAPFEEPESISNAALAEEAPMVEPASPRGRTQKIGEAGIIAEIKRWAAEHDGQPPKADEWRNATNGYPTQSAVARTFGSWSKAIAAAGFPPRTRGGQGASAEASRSERLERKPPVGTSAISSPGITAASLEPAPGPEAEPESLPEANEVLQLLDLINDLRKDEDAPGALTITRWTNGSGNNDERAEDLVCKLISTHLLSLDPAEIGSAVLSRVA